MTRWLDPEPITPPPELVQAAHGSELVARTLFRRGLCIAETARAFLDPALYTPAPPTDLPDLEAGAARLRQAIDRQESILVWGDLDADGQTATALLVEGLHGLGAQVDYYVPTRDQGHGIHEPTLSHWIEQGARLVLTCDTGVTAHSAVDLAHSLGAEVIITDHHIPEATLPPALAVINPHRLPADHPLATLSGVGVAHQLIRALDPPTADLSLDLVALGMIADVAALTGDTRYLVQRGLDALRVTPRPGLQALYRAADLDPAGLSEEHVGFVLGPRLNSLGRLADPSQGVELLLTQDPDRAHEWALELERLNARRQLVTTQITQAALNLLRNEPKLVSDYQALVLSHATWPGGVIGIVAGRLAERYGKPAVLIAAPEGRVARGSGRSIPGVDLVAALKRCAHLLEGFGGHAAAAGFSIQAERIPELRDALSRAVAAQVEALPEPIRAIDEYVTLPDLTLDLVAQISRLAPFGAGNPPLTLAVRNLRLVSEAIIGNTGEHRRVVVEDAQDASQTVFWWQGAGEPLPDGPFDLAVTARASNYRGVPEIQIEWVEAREHERPALELAATPRYEIRDCRTDGNPRAELDRLRVSLPEIQVWAEGQDADLGRPRSELRPGASLAIWTLPPGPEELRQVLDRVQPAQVFLFAAQPELGAWADLMNQVLGMAKHALSKNGGRFDLERAAGRTGHRVGTVQAALEALAAQGALRIDEREPAFWQISPGTGTGDRRFEFWLNRVKELLEETAAYRAFAARADAQALLA